MDIVYALVIVALGLALLIPLAGVVRAVADIFGYELQGWRLRKRNDEP